MARALASDVYLAAMLLGGALQGGPVLRALSALCLIVAYWMARHQEDAAEKSRR